MFTWLFLSMFFIWGECQTDKVSCHAPLSLLFICLQHDSLFMLSLAQATTITLTITLWSSGRMWWLFYSVLLWTMCLMSRSKGIKSTRFVVFSIPSYYINTLGFYHLKVFFINFYSFNKMRNCLFLFSVLAGEPRQVITVQPRAQY